MSASPPSSLSRLSTLLPGTSTAATRTASSALSRLGTATVRASASTTGRYVTATGRSATTTIRRLTRTGYATATARPTTSSSIEGSRLSGFVIIPLFIGAFVGTLLLGIALCLIFSKTCRRRLRQSNNPFSSSSYSAPPPLQPLSPPERLGPDGFPMAGAALRLSRSLEEADLRRHAWTASGDSLRGVLPPARWSQGWSIVDWLFTDPMSGQIEGEVKPSLCSVEIGPNDDDNVRPVAVAILGRHAARATFLVRLPCPSSRAPDEADLPELEFGVEVLSFDAPGWSQ